MGYIKSAALDETGFVVLDSYNEEIDPQEWLSIEYVDWKSSGDTRFAPLASAKGEIECNGFWNHTPPRTDKDGDNIEDSVDKCPSEPEDKDGFQDEDGCPDLDNDTDGIPDTLDRCPLKAGPLENGGCPDDDKDGDGVVDRQDLCPDQPGAKEMRGCPDPDKDNDGLPDRLDRCPDQAGPKDTLGCPDKDTDGDGLVDRQDVCPDQAGPKEMRGCPDPDRDNDGIPDRVDVCPDEPGVISEDRLPAVDDPVLVDTGGDVVTLRAGSHRLRYKIAAVQTVARHALATDSQALDQRGPHRLVLITCTGDYRRDRGGYASNLVVVGTPLGLAH